MKPVIFIAVFFAAAALFAADSGREIICPKCDTRNISDAIYCKGCGEALVRIYPEANHIFNVSTADVLPSLDIQLAGGGAYGLESERSFLGNIGMGLGDIAELSIATYSLFSTLGSQSATIPASSFKVRFLRGGGYIPAVAVGFRITPESDVSDNDKALAAEVGSDEAGRSLRSVDYSTRFTEASLSATLPFKRTRSTVSFRVMDIRFIDLESRWASPSAGDATVSNSTVDRDDPHYFFSVGAATEVVANATTRILLEVAGMPLYDIEDAIQKDEEVEFSTIYAVTGGVRFYFTDWLYVNSGIKYQTNYNGLADVNLRAELNIFIPTKKLVRQGRN